MWCHHFAHDSRDPVSADINHQSPAGDGHTAYQKLDELHHELVPFDAGLAQRMSDCGVRILQATDAGELLPRVAANRDFFECRFCSWSERCWGLPT